MPDPPRRILAGGILGFVGSATSRHALSAWLLFRERMHDAYVVAVNGLLPVPVHRFREWAFRNLVRNALGSGATLERSIRLTTKGGVTVGDGTIVNRGATLDGRGLLRVGAHVNISPEVMLLTSDHDPHSPAFEDRERSTVIGDRAWISSRAMVLPGARVGEGAVVAAGAVVHGAIEPWAIVAGNPARVIGQRSPDAQAALPSPYRGLFH